MNWNGGVVIVVVIANFTSNPVNRPCAETLAANFDFSIRDVVLLDMMLPKLGGPAGSRDAVSKLFRSAQRRELHSAKPQSRNGDSFSLTSV